MHSIDGASSSVRQGLSLDHEHHSFFDLTTSNQIQEFQEKESPFFSVFIPVTKTSVPNHHHVVEQCLLPQQPQQCQKVFQQCSQPWLHQFQHWIQASKGYCGFQAATCHPPHSGLWEQSRMFSLMPHHGCHSWH